MESAVLDDAIRVYRRARGATRIATAIVGDTLSTMKTHWHPLAADCADSRARRAVVIVCLTAMLFVGCDDKRRHKASEDVAFAVVEPPAEANEDPQQIATLAIQAMRDLQTVRAEGLGRAGNRAKYEEAMGRLFGVADQDQIYSMMKPNRKTGGGSIQSPVDLTKNAAVRRIAETWTSKTAHYIDGVMPESIQTAKAGEQRVVVVVEAVNAAEQAMLAEIRSGEGMGDPATPFKQLSAELQGKIRNAALQRGFNVPVEAVIRLYLAQGASGWRVQTVDVIAKK